MEIVLLGGAVLGFLTWVFASADAEGKKVEQNCRDQWEFARHVGLQEDDVRIARAFNELTWEGRASVHNVRQLDRLLAQSAREYEKWKKIKRRY